MRSYRVDHSFDVDLEPNGDIYPKLKLIVGDRIVVNAREIRIREFTEMLRSQTIIVLAKRKGWLTEIKFRRYAAARSFTIGGGTDRCLKISKGDLLEYDGLMLKYEQRVEVAPNLRSASERGWIVPYVEVPREPTIWERALSEDL